MWSREDTPQPRPVAMLTAMTSILAAAAHDRKALGELKRLGFAEPRAALANLHALTPEPSWPTH